MSLILNFLTEISIIVGNPQTLPQIRIDDVEEASCLNVNLNYVLLNAPAKDFYQFYKNNWGGGETE
jgi:hypothetical protein